MVCAFNNEALVCGTGKRRVLFFLSEIEPNLKPFFLVSIGVDIMLLSRVAVLCPTGKEVFSFVQMPDISFVNVIDDPPNIVTGRGYGVGRATAAGDRFPAKGKTVVFQSGYRKKFC